MPRLPVLVALIASVLLTGCSGVYFNTTFNAEKAHKKALSMKANRMRLAPDDSVGVTGEERAMLQRSVMKSSKVLELWPNDPKYAPRAVFRIAECQYLLEDYGSAAVKYDEFIRYFPTHEKVPLARVRLARTYFDDGKNLAAREALAEVMAAQPAGEVRREALLLSARMMIAERTEALAGGDGDAAEDGREKREALALYEQLLGEGAFTEMETRNEVRWRAAGLAYELGEWEKARALALAANEGSPPMRIQFRNRRMAIVSVYELGRHGEGLSEVRSLQGKRPYRAFRADMKVLEARGEEGRGDWGAARRMYREAVRLGPRQAAGAEAWYRVGARFLDVENREDSARVFFDSAAAAGRGYEFGLKGSDLAGALRRLAELRLMDSAARAPALVVAADPASGDPDSARAARADSAGRESDRGGGPASEVEARRTVAAPPSPQYAPFMIAELFQFRLEKPDSAKRFLTRIIADTGAALEDSIYTRRAYYALAWLEAEGAPAGRGDKARSDSLYRALMTRYPATEWAKAAERNLGLPSTVRTPEDSARALFLEAERRRFAGDDVNRVVKPAYQAVITRHPRTQDAAKAQFVLAFLSEETARARPATATVIDSLKAQYALVRDNYGGTRLAEAASARIEFLASASDTTSVTSGSPSGGSRGQGEPEGEVLEGETSGSGAREERLDDQGEQDLY